jgi:hypothetical protein
MKDWLQYFIIMSVLFFIPFDLFCQPDIKDSSIAHDSLAQRGITEMSYSSISPNDLTPADETFQEPGKKSETGPDEPSKKKTIPVWVWSVIGLILGIFAGGFLIYQYSKSRIYSILADEKYKYLDDLKQDAGQNLLLRKYFRYIGIVAKLKLSKDQKKNIIENNNREIGQLKRQNEKLRAENERNEKVMAEQKIAADIQASARDRFDGDPGKSFRINKTEIYFTIPEGDGSFKTVNARNGPDVDCFYKILPDKSGQRGKLYFISGDYDLRALDNIDYYLNPVCEIQNISDRAYARKISMTDPGSVIKLGDIWKIEENNKVKIKLF